MSDKRCNRLPSLYLFAFSHIKSPNWEQIKHARASSFWIHKLLLLNIQNWYVRHTVRLIYSITKTSTVIITWKLNGYIKNPISVSANYCWLKQFVHYILADYQKRFGGRTQTSSSFINRITPLLWSLRLRKPRLLGQRNSLPFTDQHSSNLRPIHESLLLNFVGCRLHPAWLRCPFNLF